MPSSLATYCFSLFTLSVLSSKALRFLAHLYVTPLGPLLLYLPTYVVLDFIAIAVARLLFWPQARSWLSITCSTIGVFSTILAAGGASAQLGFYLKTGTELYWTDAGAFATNKNGILVLLSGRWPVLACGSFLLTLSFFAQNFLYRVIGDLVAKSCVYLLKAVTLLRRCLSRTRRARKARTSGEADSETNAKLLGEDESYTRHVQSPRLEATPGWTDKDSDKGRKRRCCIHPALYLACKIAVALYTLIVFAIRPHRPYDHISATLPVSMLDMFRAGPSYCAEQKAIMNNEWPFPDLVRSERWTSPNGYFKGWAPGDGSGLVDAYLNRTAEWVPEDVPRGFGRWDPKWRTQDGSENLVFTSGGEGDAECGNVHWRDPFYNPVDDPLRITNLDTDILEPIREALDDGSVKIKHVVYILMESLRAEFFPLRQGSDIHKAILELSPKRDWPMINERLSHLTPHIEKLTGVSGNFKDADGSPYGERPLKWDDRTEPGKGGVNVIGGLTSATMSTKSFAANHCGVWTMPVEKFDEADTDSYQPCMPQILSLLNSFKSTNGSDDPLEQEWRTGLFESQVEEYDRQEVFDEKLGFDHIVTRERLERGSDFDPTDPKFQKVNYFAFAEQVLAPHIKEFITKTVANKQRVWLSHFTSTTHHAWRTPDWFETEDYMPTGLTAFGHRDFNRYLNTIRFHDAWMGELMQLLDDVGISNETLVVFAGDHGAAFTEDDGVQGTYNNPHISNLRVPITFRHPHLPQVQYHANATTISTLPTILDLLIHTGSLNKKDNSVAADLVQEYEGQSLIRPYKNSEDGRRAWNFAVINSGAKMLVVTSADTPYLLTTPRTEAFPYRMANLDLDPMELDPIVAWTIEDIAKAARKRYGDEAGEWADEAEQVGFWWSNERKRLWKHHLKEDYA